MPKMTKAQLERAHELAVHIEIIDAAIEALKEEAQEAALIIGLVDDEENQVVADDETGQVSIDKAIARRILGELRAADVAELKKLGIEL